MGSIKTTIKHFNVLQNYQESPSNIKVFLAKISDMLRCMMILSRLLKMDNLYSKRAKGNFRFLINNLKFIKKNKKA